MNTGKRLFGALPIKSVVFTVFVLGLFGIVTVGNHIARGRFFQIGEFGLACLICWFFDMVSIAWVEAARRRSERDDVGIWIAVLPRLGGPMLSVILLSILVEPETFGRLLACLLFVYLVSLPVAVYLTLPTANRKIEPENVDAENSAIMSDD